MSITVNKESLVEVAPSEVKQEAINSIEHLLIMDNLCVDRYEILRKVLDMLDHGNSFDLGDGLKLQLTNEVVDKVS